MFRFGKQVESALLALKALSEQNGSGLAISEISVKFGLSRNSLSKIMQSLQTAEILDSSQGLRGGYKLHKNLEQISFYDVLDALGEIKRLKCSDGETCTLVENCSISSPLQKWEKEFEQSLKATNLQKLLTDEQKSQYSSSETRRSERTCL